MLVLEHKLKIKLKVANRYMYPLNLEHLKTLKYLPLEREKDREMEKERKRLYTLLTVSRYVTISSGICNSLKHFVLVFLKVVFFPFKCNSMSLIRLLERGWGHFIYKEPH